MTVVRFSFRAEVTDSVDDFFPVGSTISGQLEYDTDIQDTRPGGDSGLFDFFMEPRSVGSVYIENLDTEFAFGSAFLINDLAFRGFDEENEGDLVDFHSIPVSSNARDGLVHSIIISFFDFDGMLLNSSDHLPESVPFEILEPTVRSTGPSGDLIIFGNGRVSANLLDLTHGDEIMLPEEPGGFDTVDVFRFFNTQAGGHFFTTSSAERNFVRETLPQLNDEGVGFEALPADSTTDGATDVFRFFNTQAGGHFFTTDPGERDLILESLPQFNFEGVGFDAFENPAEGSVPVYRFFNTQAGGHFFTTSPDERDLIIATLPQFNFEGIGFYAFPDAVG